MKFVAKTKSRTGMLGPVSEPPDVASRGFPGLRHASDDGARGGAFRERWPSAHWPDVHWSNADWPNADLVQYQPTAVLALVKVGA